MSTGAGALSSVPSLPPLHICTAIQDLSNRDSPQTTRNSPASRQSFTTARTSSRQGTPVPTDNTDFRAVSPSSATPLGLRKSLSVDSFVQYGRASSQESGSNRGDADLAGRAFSGNISDATTRLRQENDIIQRCLQLRNSMVENDLAALADSDAERSDSLYLFGDKSRRMSSRGVERTKVPRGGELPLPYRPPTVSMTSSSSGVSVASFPSREQFVHRLQSLSSLQSVSRRSIHAPFAHPAGRMRSGSLGVYATQAGKPILVNTRVSTRDSDPNSEITLAIIGAAGCGKTTVIRKGLKNYGLSEATVFYIPSVPIDVQGPPRYTRRIGRVTQNENTPDCALHIFEVLATHPNCDTSSKQTFWPDGAPRLDGVIICYDASELLSFSPVENLLQGYRALKLPTIVLACKSDLDRQVEPQKALEVLQKYDAGLVEVANTIEGKEKMRRSFDWLLKAIYRERRSTRNDGDSQYRNPASPDLVMSPPALWDNPQSAASTSPVASVTSMSQSQISLPRQSSVTTLPTSRTSTSKESPTRARSMGDLLSEVERSKNRDWPAEDAESITHLASASSTSLTKANLSGGEALSHDEVRDERHDNKEKESRPTQWASLEELLDKLLFLAVSGDDPAFISHFLLTYRRFASPRSVLLAMQKRMRQLDNPSGDPMFACFAQMRICGLLETWIHDYPNDFAVRGTAGALSALIKSIIAKTYLLHYGSDFLPFLEYLPNLVDEDAAWSVKPDDIADENDDNYSLGEDDEEATPITETCRSDSTLSSPASLKGISSLMGHGSSSGTSLLTSSKTSHVTTAQPDGSDLSAKQLCRELVKVAQEVNALDPEEIAQEITRIGATMFLDIQPRHWLKYTFVSGKKDPRTCTIAGFNEVSNHLAEWVVSLILCHDRPRARAKQIEKFVEVAQKLRALNNYSALRAFVAGINSSTFPGDDTMEIFKTKSPEHAKHLRSWDVLLQHIRSHRTYRMALRNSKGACIPALEVHISDLIRAHEGNLDQNPDIPNKVHWGKYNMIGKFIQGTVQCQMQCRNTNDYNFAERNSIQNLIVRVPLMSDEMQKSRIAPPPDMDMVEDPYRTQLPRNPVKDPLLRKFMFWS